MRYKPDLQPALTDLSLTVEPGERIAVVGRTGAGKSSLYQLLLGFRQANKGSLLVGDDDLKSMKLTLLRSEINVVLQNPFVVQTLSIRENLDPKKLFSDRILLEALEKSGFNLRNGPISGNQSTFQASRNNQQKRELLPQESFGELSSARGEETIDLDRMASELTIG